MSKSKEAKTDWPAILFAVVAIPFAFEYGGVWIGVFVLVVGIVALGWDKRHDGPFPTNKE